jgi:hypothetical protein
MKKILFIVLFTSFGFKGIAQNSIQPFLFTLNTLTGDKAYWNFHYSGSYGERTTGQFGYDGLGQQLGVKGYLGNRFTLYATAAMGFAHGGGVTSAQQVEVIRDLIGGQVPEGFRIGAGLGMSRDWSNVKSAISRITLSFNQPTWLATGNLRFEKAFASSRDKLDFISSLGYQHRISNAVFLGFEAVGQDLEGFWEEDEAEGGAKLMVGPSVNLSPVNSNLSFSLSGGPVFYATRSNAIPSEAIREIGAYASRNGYSIRALINFNLHR